MNNSIGDVVKMKSLSHCTGGIFSTRQFRCRT
jgi:hypothetical protein